MMTDAKLEDIKRKIITANDSDIEYLVRCTMALRSIAKEINNDDVDLYDVLQLAIKVSGT